MENKRNLGLEELIEELKKYDNSKGYKLDYKQVSNNLKPIINQLISKGEESINKLHELLNFKETWSSLFALEILKEIKSEKSIPYLINYIVETDNSDDDSGEEAMYALQQIGKPAIKPLIEKLKNQFSQKKFPIYLVGALTEIKDKRVYDFMIQITQDYLKNEYKYDEWFHIDMFVLDFDKQGKREVLPLLKQLLNIDRVSKHERIEIQDTIKRLEDPISYNKELEKQKEELKPLMKEDLEYKKNNKQSSKLSKKEIQEIEENMWKKDEELEIQFKCLDCNKKQNIHPGLIKIISSKPYKIVFENELICKFCFSHNLKPTQQGEKDVMFQSISTFVRGKGVINSSEKVAVEDKVLSFKDTYKYILKRIKEEPNKGELYLRAGNIARNFNKYSEAIEHYKKSLELDSNLIASYLNLVGVYEFRYRYYKTKGAKEEAIFYLNAMADLLRKDKFEFKYLNLATLKGPEIIIQFLGEMSESLGVHIPELIKVNNLEIDNSSRIKKKKVRRNEPCPCGSGKKYKKCCLNNE
ncbi:MAG: SEC-C metal-binding domain-containing protein [Nanoarchaeota archaeon]